MQRTGIRLSCRTFVLALGVVTLVAAPRHAWAQG